MENLQIDHLQMRKNNQDTEFWLRLHTISARKKKIILKVLLVNFTSADYRFGSKSPVILFPTILSVHYPKKPPKLFKYIAFLSLLWKHL